jgi:putative transposase
MAKRRFNISVLNYIVTSNHIHLLVSDTSGKNRISEFMQLIQGRTAQEYNLRKNRKGAFWEDRYHATAVESGEHIMQCMTYINMNMVRAGAVSNPIHWKESGYNEIQFPKKRYSIIDFPALLKILSITSVDQLKKKNQEWSEEKIEKKELLRDRKWTDAIAVGSEAFLEKIRFQLDVRAKFRSVRKSGNGYELSDSVIPYREEFHPKTGL